MGVASMVIGIISLLVGLVPFCGVWAVVPAVVGIGLGIADIVSKSNQKKGRGMAIAGLILNPLAILTVVLWWLLAAVAMEDTATDFQQQMMQSMQDLQKMQNQKQNIPTIPLPPDPAGQPSPGLQPMQPMDTPATDSSTDSPSKPSAAPSQGTPPSS